MNCANEMTKEGYKLLSEYKNARTKLKYECPKGHEGYMHWYNWKKGRRCKECFSERQKTSKLTTPNPYHNEKKKKYNIGELARFIRNIKVLPGITLKSLENTLEDAYLIFKIINEYNKEELSVVVYDGNFLEKGEWAILNEESYPIWIYNEIVDDLESLMDELDERNIIRKT